MLDQALTESERSAIQAEAEQMFVRGGYARADFQQSPSWRAAYERVNEVSRQFVSLAWRNGFGSYFWPLDPLNCWSRVWEYAFIADQLRRHDCERRGLRLLDVGAAVTFFPYYLIRQGLEVTNLDFDPEMPAHFRRVFRLTGRRLGVMQRPKYLTADARDTKLPAGSFDIITCISVLEHIPEWERAVAEVSRLLKRGGHFFLTFDVQHIRPADALSADECGRLLHLISESMDSLTHIENSIPANVLTPFTSTWQAKPIRDTRSRLARLWPISAWPRKFADRKQRKKWATEPKLEPEDICVFGGVWRKRSAV